MIVDKMKEEGRWRREEAKKNEERREVNKLQRRREGRKNEKKRIKMKEGGWK